MSFSALFPSTSSSAGDQDSVEAEALSDTDETLSILQPIGYSSSTCGYCAEEKGWRRSGCYMYKPDNANTCCVQYTISQDSSQFKPTRSQRQVLQRFSNFVKLGTRQGEKGWGPPLPNPQSSRLSQPPTATTSSEEKAKSAAAKGKGKAKNQSAFDYNEMLHSGDWENSPPSSSTEEAFKNKFEYTVEPASFTEEKYALFKRYQMEVHSEPESKVSVKGFKRFLVDTPLDLEPTSHPSGLSYGSHHCLYRLNGTLIAFAVLDLLPLAVSSVYFVWNPDWSGMSLGKVSALREIGMVREFEEKGVWEKGKGRYMMGYYIEVPKMRYKADYQPSFLLDPATNVYYPWEHCKPLINLSMPFAASFSQPSLNPPPSTSTSNSNSKSNSTNPSLKRKTKEDDSSEEEEDDEEEEDSKFPSPPPPGCLDPSKPLPKGLLMNSLVLESRTLVPLLLSTAWHDREMQSEVKELLSATGESCQGRLAIWMGR